MSSAEPQACYRCEETIVPTGVDNRWVGPRGQLTCPPDGMWAHRPAPVDPYPEHEKMTAVQTETQAVGEFLEWVMSEHHCELGRPEGRRAEFRSVGLSVQQLLANWKGIDLVKAEQEKRAMLKAMRRRNAE
jgi:hypothetical protein